MKHIKKFNEELDPSTYRRIADKLDNIRSNNSFVGNFINSKERSNSLRKHADEMSFLESFKENIKLSEKYSKYGEFDMLVSDVKGKFNIGIELMCDSIINDFEGQLEVGNNDSLNLGFMISLIPSVKDIDAAKNLAKKLTKNYLDYSDGYFHIGWVDIKYELKDNGSKFKEVNVYSESRNNRFNFENRKSSVLFKKLLCSFFDPTSDYPYSLNDDKNSMYEIIETKIIQNLDISSDYGLDMGKIKEDLSSLSILNFYAVY